MSDLIRDALYLSAKHYLREMCREIDRMMSNYESVEDIHRRAESCLSIVRDCLAERQRLKQSEVGDE